MIGTTLQDRYRLDAELGRGGMGVIYRAHDTLLDRDVAIKVLSDPALSTESRARLLHEAQAAAQLNHPNIVSIHDAGEAEMPAHAGTVPFIVMELVEGKSLLHRKPRDLDEVIALARQICAALDHAHAKGIVHRDLKPENVIVTADGTAKLTDFGLARTVTSRLTVEGTILGTVFYFAPEQAMGQDVDGRADLYALGVMLYELTTGELPFKGDDIVTVISQHLHAAVIPPSTHNGAIPPALDALIVQLLNKRPEDRPPSAAQVRQRLEDLSRPEITPTAYLPESGVWLAERPLQPPLSGGCNLPAQTTPFIGREAQLAAVRHELIRSENGVRLLTLTGPGGTGKTRLSMQVAADLSDHFADGVFFVSLAPIRDPALVMPAISQTLGVREVEGQHLLRVLKDYLRDKHVLLVLDNFEQVTEAAPVVSDLLSAAPRIKVLATSRALLRVRGEHVYPVPPLVLPDPKELLPLKRLRQIEAVQLFVQRARSVKADFTITDENGPAVAEICARLDGLPLAIELAAARVRLLPPQKMLAQLDDRFRLLTGGARDLPARHQTLRGAVDWSHNLLSADEQDLFRRLAVFCCSCTLEAAEAVCSLSGDPSTVNATSAPGQVLDILNGLGSLMDQSLLQSSDVDGEPRFGMLETIREYALERLADSGEAEAVRRQHAGFFLALAEEAEPKVESAEQMVWLNRLETEHDNLRTAIGWALEREGTDVELGLRLVGALGRFWRIRGYWTEGRRWLERALERSSRASAPARAKVLWMAGRWQETAERARPLLRESLNLYQQMGDKHGVARVLHRLGGATGDFEQATALIEQSLARFQELDDKSGISETLFSLGIVAWRRQGDYERGTALLEQSLALARETGDKWRIARGLRQLGNMAVEQVNYERAQALFEESLTLARELSDKEGIAGLLNSLGEMARLHGDYERAAVFYDESLALRRELGSKSRIAMMLHNRGYVALRQGDGRQAATFFEDSMTLYRELENKTGIAECLVGLAGVAGAEGQPEWAARLFGAVEALVEATGDHLAAADQAEYDHNVATVRAQLDEATFAAAWEEGRRMTADATDDNWGQTVAYALEGTSQWRDASNRARQVS
jgi:predicted ATPase/serine/threonine protein kinase